MKKQIFQILEQFLTINHMEIIFAVRNRLLSGKNLHLKELTPNGKGIKTENGRVASPESISIP